MVVWHLCHSPIFHTPVFFNSGTIEISGVINGIEIEHEEKLFKISENIIDGKVSDLAQSNSIIIGKGLAEKMLLSKGDNINITSSRGNVSMLKVVGISQIGIAEIDNTFSYTSLETAQKLLDKPVNYITDIQMK